MKALWKQDTPLHPSFQRFHRCLDEDWFLLPHELSLQHAHAATLHHAGILDAKELAALRAALAHIEADYADQPAPDSDAEDLHTWIEGQLTTLAGSAGEKIHTARSRNDQVATLLRLYIIDVGVRLEHALRDLLASIATRSREWSTLQFPLQTHAQFAAPGSVGAWSMRYAVALERALEQTTFHLGQWTRFCPLGAGAIAGSSIPIDRTIQAEQLGFTAPSPNALDSTCTRDDALELLALGTRIALHLQSLATDAIAFSQTPFRWAAYPAAFATGSSMMPNKSNPDALELLRGAANEVIAAGTHATFLMKGLPSGYNRDLQCMKPVVHRAAETLIDLITLARAFIDALRFDEQRLRDALDAGDIQATLRMEERVRAGETLRRAHHAEADPTAAAVRTDLDATRYQTVGAASPAEADRTAAELLDRLHKAAAK